MALGSCRRPALATLRAQVVIEQSLQPGASPTSTWLTCEQARRDIVQRARSVEHHHISRVGASRSTSSSGCAGCKAGRSWSSRPCSAARGMPVVVVTFLVFWNWPRKAWSRSRRRESFAPIYVRLAYAPAFDPADPFTVARLTRHQRRDGHARPGVRRAGPPPLAQIGMSTPAVVARASTARHRPPSARHGSGPARLRASSPGRRASARPTRAGCVRGRRWRSAPGRPGRQAHEGSARAPSATPRRVIISPGPLGEQGGARSAPVAGRRTGPRRSPAHLTAPPISTPIRSVLA